MKDETEGQQIASLNELTCTHEGKNKREKSKNGQVWNEGTTDSNVWRFSQTNKQYSVAGWMSSDSDQF